MIEPIEFHKLFYTPVWRYEYPRYREEAQRLVDHLTNDDLYLSQREKNGLQITRANLHKDDNLKDLYQWILECCESTMIHMGYEPRCGITSMWATRQRAGGFHHLHSHKNSFLGGSFYLFDMEGKAEGTTFNNSDSSKYVIQPTRLKDRSPMLTGETHLPFIPGTLVLFPAWAQHLTRPNPSAYRIIVGINCMPIGMTDDDHFDRYNFPDPSSLKLKEYSDV